MGWARQVHLSPAPSYSAWLSCLFQPPGGVPGTQPLLPNSMDPTRQQGRGQGRATRCMGSLCCLTPLPTSQLPYSLMQGTPTWEDQCKE